MLRLNSWLAQQGGIKDPGGDVRDIIGGYKGRPGLINNTRGMALDDAALAAWEAGYFFGQDRPSINDLIDMIAQDHSGRIPVYAEADFAEVDAERATRLPDSDPAVELLRAIVKVWRETGEGGKRRRLRPLLREAERMVA